MTDWLRRIVLAALLTSGLGGWWLSAAGRMPSAEACAFLRTPQAYEADSGRSLYMQTIDAASVDAIFPGDPTFGLPAVEVGGRASRTPGPRTVPASILRAIGWTESTLEMAARSVPFQSTGPALVSFDCGHGIMQITTGMTVPLGVSNQPTNAQSNIATHYAYNVARGAAMLAANWNGAPELRPIAGTDTNSNPAIVENWYFAIWAYNGFTGPGANISNHPLDPQFANPREAWRCDGSQSRTRFPYQELIYGCMANPPSANGVRLWAPVPASLPNLSLPQYFQPLSLANFVFPYTNMDIPSPAPSHIEAAPAVPGDARSRILGSPVPSVTSSSIELRADSGPGAMRASVSVGNSGTGILVWSAQPSANWIVVDPPAGVALGSDVPCNTSQGCRASSSITISVNPVLLPTSAASGTVTIAGTNAAGTPATVTVHILANFDSGAPGTSRAY